MKTIYLLTCMLVIMGLSALAQDTVRVNVLGKNMVTVVESGAKTDVKIGNNTIDIRDNAKDTVKIRVGKKTMVITEGKHDTTINYNKDKEAKGSGHDKFKGHWDAFEIGVNSFAKVDYTGYPTPNFMDLNHNKSLEVNLNVVKISIGLQKNHTSVGLVTGLGLNFNDYRFSNSYTIKNDNGYVVAVPITDAHLQKTKLSTGYLTAPLLLEFQLPKSTGMWMSVGVIGGIKIGSHTKVKIDDKKNKDRNDFNINPFRGGVTARVGHKGFNVFGTYYFTPFFRDGRGPVMQPFTIGVGLFHW